MTGITKNSVSTLIAAVFILGSVAMVEAEDSFLCMDKVGTLAVSDQCSKYGEALNVQDLGQQLVLALDHVGNSYLRKLAARLRLTV